MAAINLSEIAGHILAGLEIHHVGKDRAVKRADLLNNLRRVMADPLLTDRQMRKAIEKCAPQICSGSTGYFLPMTEAEKTKAILYLDKKIYGLAARRRAIIESNAAVGPRQIGLPL